MIYADSYSHPSSLSSYVEDPIWQGKFTAIWCSCLGAAIIISLPSLLHALTQGRALAGFFGLSEGSGKIWYSAVISEEKTPPSPSLSGRRKIAIYWDSLVSVRQWSVPYLELNAGQGTYSTRIRLPAWLTDLMYFSLHSRSISCDHVGMHHQRCTPRFQPKPSRYVTPLHLYKCQFVDPTFPGFLAFAQFPIVFLFATKNSVLSFLLGPGNGYEKLNFLHRMAGRIMFLAAAIHGGLWIRNHIQYDLPILGPQKETSGVASLAVLGCIVLLSLRPIRRWFYQVFFVIQ
jgi:ferric-chelate reductase